MAKIKLNGDTSGYIEISAPAVSYNNTLELGPGTKILTNLDNTFTGVSTFSSDVYLGNDIYLTDGSSGYEKVEVGINDIRVESKHIHSEFGVWTRSTSIGDRRNGIDGDNNDLRLYANSAEKVRITGDGKLGINITNPTRQLEIYSSSHATAALQSDTQSSLFFSDPSDTNIGQISYMHSGNYMYFRVNDAERLRIGSDGHLSYKNSSPPAWSTDSGYANATLGSSAYFRTDTDVNSNFFSLGSNAYRGSSNWQHVNSGWATQLQQSAHTGDLYYSSSSTSGSADGTITWVEHFRATSAGNFGIGENSPADRLVVQKTNASGDVAIRIKNDTLTDGSSSTPTTASLYLNTSTGDFNSFYIQARRYDNDTHFGYSNPRDGGHTPNMIITNEGQIRTPKQPSFGCIKNGNQYPVSGQRSIITPWTEHFDQGSNFNATTGVFTAPVAGKYYFYISAMQDRNDNGDYQLSIYRNGSMYYNSNDMASNSGVTYMQTTVCGVVEMSANDTVDFRMYNSTATSSYIYTNHYTHCGGYLIG